MRFATTILLSFGLLIPAAAQGQAGRANPLVPVSGDLRAVSPALAQHTEEGPLGEVWKRPDLSPRDRSIVTISILIARGQTTELPFYLDRALDGGVKPAEISEIVTHLAFYAGWSSANAAAPYVKEAFARRGIGPDQLPKAAPAPLPLDEAREAARAKFVGENFSTASPGPVNDTTNFLFKDLWLRPDLTPTAASSPQLAHRQRPSGAADLPPRARDGQWPDPRRGREVISHVAFYAGWPNAFSAMTVAKGVFEARAK